jgi:rhodanese-related sulfurtransferase
MYRDDVSPTFAMERLNGSSTAVLLDVRFFEELEDVGMPDVPRYMHAEWLNLHSGEVNPHFVDHVDWAGVAKDTEIFVLCRVGERSVPAAIALAKAGYTQVYNIDDGFEGDADAEGYRGTVCGWIYEGLPWREDVRRAA